MSSLAAESPREAPAAKRVLLVQMPWANASLPSLALGLLKSILQKAGLPCDTLYGNLLSVAALGGWDTYDRLSVELASELVFSPLYFGTDRRAAADKLAAEFGQSTVNPTHEPDYYLQLIGRAEEFIEQIFLSTPWHLYDVVGFSLTFQQTTPSLCLARRIKERYPEVNIVFGGASCDGDMGPEMVRSFPEVDYAVVGEADRVIVEIVRGIRGRQAGAEWPPRVAGLVYRDRAGETRYTGAVPPTADLDELPEPDYAEYFALIGPLGGAQRSLRLYVEQSRGCWYGEKMACRFCGLSEMKFRRKSPGRAVTEMLSLSTKYQVSDFYMSDNILDYKYYDTVLPEIARLRHEDGYDFTMFYEVKANLKKRQVQMMAAAGVVMVQIGIESFDDHILHLMSKGVSAIQQIQSLKHLAEYGIKAVWNILYANPLELPEDYRRMATTLPFLHHLPPPQPGQVSPMVLQRFSRYWQAPASYGISGVRPLPLYRDIFPDRKVNLDQLACFFDYEHEDQKSDELKAARQELFDAADLWRRSYREGSLTYASGPGWVKVTDKRAAPGESSAVALTLRGLQAAIFNYCDSARSFRHICEHFAGQAPPERLGQFLDLMVQRRLMFRSQDGKYLSLPLHSKS